MNNLPNTPALTNTGKLQIVTIYKTEKRINVVECVDKFIYSDGCDEFINYRNKFMPIKDNESKNGIEIYTTMETVQLMAEVV